eukprot:TRINITY_DN279_c0_g1_i1.p1 TRINITY_DN279_c0_g1~~TRINITY_DN279_c0_g1_i1.p1  ORF type:complete len:599 (+),score=58.06 TRINITY_DN279_c0_g1_i1:26-1798(+)
MKATIPLLVSLLTRSVFLQNAAPTKFFNFQIDHDYRYPDGFKSMVVLTNGQFFAPEIRVQQNDQIHASFTNNFVTDVFTVHWHGIRQHGSQWYDGTHMGTQCSILDEFTYKFVAEEEPGSYFYHGHQGAMRIAGLQGPFIIEDPPELKAQLGYDEDFTLFFQDWYHEDATLQLLGLDQPVQGTYPHPPYFTWVGDPATYLINGKGYWNATGEDVSETNFNQSMAAFETFTVEPGKTYMLRIIGATSLSYSNVWIEGHNMTVVRADGQLLEPFEVDSIDVNTGDRYDVIIQANQPSGHYFIQVETRFRNLVKGWALLSYSDAPANTRPTVFNPIGLDSLPDNPPPFQGESWDPREIYGLEELQGELAELYPDRTLYINSDQKVIKSDTGIDQLRWGLAVNDKIEDSRAYNFTRSPLMTILVQDRCDLVDDNVLMWPDVCNGEENIKVGEIIDIVFQNYPALNGVVEQHPWHLHGYTFYVLGYGPGNFTYEKYGDLLNLVNPPKKDTVTVYPSVNGEAVFNGTSVRGIETLTPEGWTVVRFRADNPGVWNIHCHITWHFMMGMEMFIIEDIEMIPPPPEEMLDCGPVSFDSI